MNKNRSLETRIIVFGVLLVAFCAGFCSPAHAKLTSVTFTSDSAVDVDTRDVLFADFHTSGDTFVYFKKFSDSDLERKYMIIEYSITRGGTTGLILDGDPAVFYGLSAGPGRSVLYTRSGHTSATGARAVYASFFSAAGATSLLVSAGSYPDYVYANKTYNFAYVKENNIYVAAMQHDTPALTVSGVQLTALADSGTIRSPRWSPDAEHMVFMHENTNESQAQLYMIANVQTQASSGNKIAALNDSNVVKLTNDTFYNAWPDFVGNDSFVLYSRADPLSDTGVQIFKFSNFSESEGFDSVALDGVNWDVRILDRRVFVDSYPVAVDAGIDAISASGSPQGLVLIVSDTNSAATDGNLYVGALRSVQAITAASVGHFVFPAGGGLIISTAGAFPNCNLTVMPDTFNARTFADTRAPTGLVSITRGVSIFADVPPDSADLPKLTVFLMYTDYDVDGGQELAVQPMVHDTASRTWLSASLASIDATRKIVTISDVKRFTSYSLGFAAEFNIRIDAKNCVLGRIVTGRPAARLRNTRDRLLDTPLGRKCVVWYFKVFS